MPDATKKNSKKPGARPRGPYENKRRTLTTRITERTRQRLQESADAADRSFSQEVELRLEQSFDLERNVAATIEAALGGPAVRMTVLQFVAAFTLRGAEKARGKGLSENPADWMRDAECYRAAAIGAAEALIQSRPDAGWGTKEFRNEAQMAALRIEQWLKRLGRSDAK